MDKFDWQGRTMYAQTLPRTVQFTEFDEGWNGNPRTVTAPRTAEQSISLMSAGISALDGVAMTDDEKERVWRLIEKATHAVGEKT